MKKADAFAFAAKALSLEESEISDVVDSDAGPLITTTDGQTYIVVPEDQPDADGKTGVMFAKAPHEKYGGTFPVYAQPGADEEAEEAGAPDGDAVPTGSADHVKAWVGDDLERAQAALEVEEERDKPRSTLIAHLEAIIEAG